MHPYGLLFCLCFAKILPAQPVAVMLDKMNTVYVGVPNPFQVVVSDIPPERLVVKVSQGNLEAMDRSMGKFQWIIAEMSSKKAWMILADSCLEQPIDTLVFRVSRLQEPKFSIPESVRYGIGGIHGYFENYCSEYLRPTVLEYDVTFVLEGQDPVVKHNMGARLSDEIADYFRVVGLDCVVYFTNIRWYGGFDHTIRKSEQTLTFRPR